MTAGGTALNEPVSQDGIAEPQEPEAGALGFAYVANFAALSSSAPFFAMYLADRGFRADHVSWILGGLLLVNVVATLAWTTLADAIGSIGTVLRVVSFGALVCAAPAFAGSRVVLLAGLVLLALFRAPFGALLDALAVETGRRFGPIRAWGTAGYVLGALATGWLTTKLGPRGVGYATGTLLVLAASASLAIPVGPHAPTRSPFAIRTRPPLGSLFLRPRFLGLLGVALLLEVGLAPYDALFPAYLARMSDGMLASVALAVGALAELLFLAFAGRWAARVHPVGLLVLAGVASVVRWAVIASVTVPVVLAATQVLHALSFGAFYFASILLVNDECPVSLRAAGQGAFRAFAFGLAPAASLFFAGWLERAHGFRAVFVVAAASAGVACALATRLRLRSPLDDASLTP